MNDIALKQALLALNTVELRAAVGVCLNELKSRKQSGTPAKVVSTLAAPKAAAPKAPVKPGPTEARPFGVVCVATGKTLKRSYATQAEADAAAADLSVQMKREYQTVAA